MKDFEFEEEVFEKNKRRAIRRKTDVKKALRKKKIARWRNDHPRRAHCGGCMHSAVVRRLHHQPRAGHPSSRCNRHYGVHGRRFPDCVRRNGHHFHGPRRQAYPLSGCKVPDHSADGNLCAGAQPERFLGQQCGRASGSLFRTRKRDSQEGGAA